MPDLLQDVVLTYAVALGLLLAAAWLRVPLVVALVGTGMLAGPGGLGVVGTREDVHLLAEVGIVLLLFMVGLEFSLRDLRERWRLVVGGGLLQVALTTLAGAGLAQWAFAPGWPGALFLGFFVALSSTAIVIKALAQHDTLHAPHGHLAVGVLLLQDLAVVVVLVLLPSVSGAETSGGAALAGATLRLGAAAVGLVLVGRLALPALLRLVSRAGRDAFSMAVLLVSLGSAWVTAQLGLSMAVGAFLAGLVLAGSEFAHQIHAEVRPARDLLGSLFFISVGMLVDARAVAAQWPAIVGLSVLVVVLKGSAAVGALRLAGAPLRVAVAAGLALAQVGEFSFVFGKLGLELGLLTEPLWQVLLPASVVTMVATPALVAASPAAGARVARARGEPDGPAAADDQPRLEGHVVVLGFGVGGQLVARALADLGLPHVVLEMNGAAVSAARRRGVDIHFADATAPEALAAAGVARAAAVVAVLSDPDAAARAVRAVRSVAAHTPILVRSRYLRQAERLLAAGATLVVAEEMEASLEVLAQLLARLHVPDNLSGMLLDGFREATTGLRAHRAPGHRLDDLPEDVRATPVASHAIAEGDWAVGRTLAEIGLRAETQVTALAVRHLGRYLAPPPADAPLRAGDVLFLLGRPEELAAAGAWLTRGARPT